MRQYLKQALLSARTAHEALRLGDTVSSSSRAYYAMFDAARAALAALDPDLAAAKTHATVIRRFSKHLIKERGLDAKHARALRTAFDVRQVADYDADPPKLETVATALRDMDEFIAAVCEMFPDVLQDPEPSS